MESNKKSYRVGLGFQFQEKWWAVKWGMKNGKWGKTKTSEYRTPPSRTQLTPLVYTILSLSILTPLYPLNFLYLFSLTLYQVVLPLNIWKTGEQVALTQFKNESPSINMHRQQINFIIKQVKNWKAYISTQSMDLIWM